MKIKAIMIFELLIILALLSILISQYVSWETVRPVVREPSTPNESSISYQPLPPPKIALETLQRVADLKDEFSPKIEKISDDIYLARGYSLGNTIMVITDDGLVIIDSNGSESLAQEIKTEFRKISDKPVKYIIYTHGHLEHVYGSPVFMEAGTEVIATNIEVDFLKRQEEWLEPYHLRVRKTQAGRAAPDYAMDTLFNNPFPPQYDPTIVWPTITFDKEYTFELGGKRFELYHTPGETPGQLMVWMPDERALFPGDLYYASFPQLSNPMLEQRDVKGWYESLERMAALKPSYVVPSHSRALMGEDESLDVLQHYGEAIRYVYEKTIQAINDGKTLEQAIELIQLPERLAQRWNLQELYGSVEWSIRGIYQKQVGWYDGRGTKLNPLPAAFQAREIVKLAGGADKVLARAIELQRSGEYQLACELADVVIAANPQDSTARMIKADALDYIGIQAGNFNMIGFYRSAAALERQAAGIKPASY